ncbi:MAG: aminoglycoside phosphotransferase family protein [Bacteroidota bacterium]
MNIESGAQLVDYLRTRGYLKAGEMPEVTVLAGGVSNRTVLVQVPGQQGMVVKQALAKLRVKTDWFSDPSRIFREAEGMRLLADLVSQGTVPALLFEDRAHHVLGMEAIAMPHTNWKTDLLAGTINLDIVQQFGRSLAAIHAFSPADYPVDGVLRGLGFFDSLRLDPYYRYTASQVPEAATFLHQLVADTQKHQVTLVHGDYSPKNVLIRNGQMVLLDHEVIHLGDPAFDVGFSMTHLLSKMHHMPAHRSQLREAAAHYWQQYAAEARNHFWFASSETRAVRHTLACMLARVAGKSTLEYLDAATRRRQQHLMCDMLHHPPPTMADLIHSFAQLIA